MNTRPNGERTIESSVNGTLVRILLRDKFGRWKQITDTQYNNVMWKWTCEDEGRCSRCGSLIPDFKPPASADTQFHATAGYYIAQHFAGFCDTDREVYVCDKCMWLDPRFIAVHGKHNEP